MTPARPRPLPQSFPVWVSLATDEELVQLLHLVVEAVERRGYVPRCEWVRPA